MNVGTTVFSQLMAYLPMHEFRRCVKRYRGNYKIKTFSCWDQFLCMAFAQLTYRENQRDMVTCLRAFQNKLYHIPIPDLLHAPYSIVISLLVIWQQFYMVSRMVLRLTLYAGEMRLYNLVCDAGQW